jgi:PAS domain S-box-containing protein
MSTAGRKPTQERGDAPDLGHLSGIGTREQALAAIVTASPVAIGLMDAAGRIVLGNDRMERFLPTGVIPSRDDTVRSRWSAHDVEGHPIDPHDWPGSRALRGEPTLPGLEMLYTEDNGRQTRTRVACVPLLDADGRSTGAVTVITDIEAEKRAEDTLREEHARLSALVTATTYAVFRLSADGSQMLQLDGRGFIADTPSPTSTWLDLFIDPADREEVRAAVDQAIGTKSTFELEHRVLRADGSLAWALSRAVPLLDDDGEIIEWFGAASDITERKVRQANLQVLTEISADLARLSDEAEIIRVVGEKLAAHLGVDCYHYVDVDEERAEATVSHYWHAHEASHLEGTFPLAALLPRDGLERARAGKTDTVHDLQRELLDGHPGTAAPKAGATAPQIAAWVVVPDRQGGAWHAYFAVAHSQPRQWSDLDIELIEEVSERLFPRVARVRVQAALEAQKIYAESIVETLHEPLLVLTPGLRVRSANQAFYDHFEVSPEETEGQLIYELGNGQWDIPALRTLLEDVLPDSNVFNDYEVAHDFEDIGRRVMLLNARRLDHVQFILLGIRDITRRKQIEDALRASEERFRLFAEASSDVLWMREVEHLQWEYLGPAFERIYGYDRSEVMGPDDFRTWAELILPEDREHALASVEAVRNGEVVTFEYRVRRPDGRVRWLRDTDFPMLDASGKVQRIGGIGQDITEQKLLEEERELARQRAEEAAELRDQFIATVSHELRTPLTAMLLWSRVLAEDGLQAEGRRAVQAIRENALAQQHLVEDLLDTTRIMAGRLNVHRVRRGLAPIVEAAADALRPAAAEKGVELVVTTQPISGSVDRQRLAQVLANVLGNALRHTPTGGTIRVDLERSGDEAVIRVADDGEGIEPELLPLVFDRFERGRDREGEPSVRLGLGLAISRDLVEAHGGTVEAVSDGPGTGTTITITLPGVRARARTGRS